jgi:hypothetical protein
LYLVDGINAGPWQKTIASPSTDKSLVSLLCNFAHSGYDGKNRRNYDAAAILV